MDHLHDLGVRDCALGADRVEITLNELAEPSLCRSFTAKDGADGVALEGCSKLVDMLRHKSGEGHRQVKPQGEFAGGSAFVRDVEDLPENLIGAGFLARQHFHSLDVRCFDREEAK